MSAGVFPSRLVRDDPGDMSVRQCVMGVIAEAEMFSQAGKGVGFQFRPRGAGQLKGAKIFKRRYVWDGKVRVEGCLYKSNEYTHEFAKLLNDNSTRVKASVGGLFPKVVKQKENGVDVGNVVSVLWNDLALTIAPVNPTVGPAVLVKSLSSYEFVKSLSAGYGADAAAFSGGRALQKEDVGREEVNLYINDEAAIASLIGAITDGDVKDLEEAEEFLNGYGISKPIAREMIRGIVENSKNFMEVLPMAKGNLWDEIAGAADMLFITEKKLQTVAEFFQLLPLRKFRMPPPSNRLVTPFILALWGTPSLKVPEWCGVVKNIQYTGGIEY